MSCFKTSRKLILNRNVIIILTLAILMIIAFSATEVSAAGIGVFINGKEVKFTQSSGQPFIDKANRTQVPLRVTMDAYGCVVDWDDVNHIAKVKKGDIEVQVPIGESYILVNGDKVANDTAAQIKDGRTYLPIRVVLEAFGAKVNWNGESKKVVARSMITADDGSYGVFVPFGFNWEYPGDIHIDGIYVLKDNTDYIFTVLFSKGELFTRYYRFENRVVSSFFSPRYFEILAITSSNGFENISSDDGIVQYRVNGEEFEKICEYRETITIFLYDVLYNNDDENISCYINCLDINLDEIPVLKGSVTE